MNGGNPLFEREIMVKSCMGRGVIAQRSDALEV